MYALGAGAGFVAACVGGAEGEGVLEGDGAAVVLEAERDAVVGLVCCGPGMGALLVGAAALSAEPQETSTTAITADSAAVVSLRFLP